MDTNKPRHETEDKTQTAFVKFMTGLTFVCLAIIMMGFTIKVIWWLFI